MIFVHIYPDGHAPSNPGPNTVIAVSAPDIRALYVALRGLPYAAIQEINPRGGTYNVEYTLPQDTNTLTATLLRHSDEARK